MDKIFKNPDENGYYGEFGGAFVPEMLYPNIQELQNKYLSILNDTEFRKTFEELLKDYVGRHTPLYFASSLSANPVGIYECKNIDLFID